MLKSVWIDESRSGRSNSLTGFFLAPRLLGRPSGLDACEKGWPHVAKKDVIDKESDEEAVGVAEADDPKEVLKASIHVKVSDAGVLRKKVAVTVPRANIDQELEKEYKELVGEAIVPGFRRGRAPRRLVEKRFGSEVGSQVQTRLLSNAYLAAVEKEDLKVLGDPLFWVEAKEKKPKATQASEPKEELVDMRAALQHLKLPEEGDFKFECEVEVKPEFDLPNLEGIEIQRPELSIDDDDVTVQIDRIRARRGSWVPVAGGKVEPDDMLVCDMVMTVDGQEVKSAENVQLAARAQRIEGVTIEDLGEKFKGAKVGDERRFEGQLPADYPVEAHRGKQARFNLKLNDIKRLSLPPLDTQFLEAQGFDSEKDYRQWVKQQMEGQLDVEIKRGMRNQVRAYLLEKTKLELPEGLSSRQTDRAVLRRAIELQRQGLPVSEIEKHADELRTSAREQAVAELKLHFVLEQIAEDQELTVTEEEINAQIAAMARAYNRRFDRVRDDLARNDGIEMLYLQIRDEKCIDHVLGKARIVDAKMPKKSPGKGADKSADKPQKGSMPSKSEAGPEASKKAPAAKPAAAAKKKKG